MSESSAGETSTGGVSVSSAASIVSSTVSSPAGAPAVAASSQPIRSPPVTVAASTFPTYASSAGKGSAGSGAYFAPPNTSYLNTAGPRSASVSAAAHSSSSSASSVSSSPSSLPSSFASAHPLVSSTVVVPSSAFSSASSSSSSSSSSSAFPAVPRSHQHHHHTSTNAIIVSPRQRGNPVLSHIRNCPWEFAPSPASSSPPAPPLLADYLLGPTTCALYLSLRYHLLHPLYLLSRMQPLRSHYTVRLLLLQVDVDDSEPPLTEVTTACFTNGWTLLLGWSVDEIGRWLELFKVMESKGKESLEGAAADAGDEERVRDALGVVKGVNKTDVAVLMSTFGSLTALARASEAELLACVGMGAKKVKRLRTAFNQPFISSQAVRSVMGTTPLKPAHAGDSETAAGEEKKETVTAKLGGEENDRDRSHKAASPSHPKLFAPSKKQRTGAIIRLDD